MTVSISVVICAYTMRRWAEVTAAIDSVLGQTVSAQLLVVVDHNDDLLRRLRRREPNRTILPNGSAPGLSGARNTGLSAATGDIIAFLDDDAVAAPDWLAALVAPFADPRVVAVGGSAAPQWPGPRAPSLLPPELLWVVGCSYRGQPTHRAQVRNVIGCSMAFRAEALQLIGGFNVDAGRRGGLPLGAEETEVCIRVRRAVPGSRILWEPRSRVWHTVTADRTTWRYVTRRCYFEGISKAALAGGIGARDALSSERSYVRRVLPRAFCRELVHGHPSGAAAIVLSVAAAGLGFLRGRVVRRRPVAGAVVAGARAEASQPPVA